MLGKPSASLSSGLLARKGQARPAMRPQGFVSLGATSVQDDLGWNDMGDDRSDDRSDDRGGDRIAAPVAIPVAMPVATAAAQPVEVREPPVLRQVESLAAKLSAPKPVTVPVEVAAPAVLLKAKGEGKAAPVAARPAAKPAATVRTGRGPAGAKSLAAFTLRLNPDRHLRLRLASAVNNRSAQQLVTEALDAFLETLADVEALARQIDPAKKHHG